MKLRVRLPRAVALPLLAGLLAVSGAARGEPAESALMPYQMVRSLQLVQDRIAGGDHAALPMQKKLLELTDGRFRKAADSEFEDMRNVRALLIYAMSGGNPDTISIIVSRLDLSEKDRMAAAGVLAYLRGEVGRARGAMNRVDPYAHPQELGAFLFLVKGSLIGLEDAKAGMEMLDRARLLGPGTLVEEAALRRTIVLAAEAGDAARFMTASEQYARRYLRSPYAAQFAESFVTGLMRLRNGVDRTRIEDTVQWMTAEQALTIYLRLARQAAIDGDAAMLAFASERAKRYGDIGLTAGAPRSELYASISSVTSETVDEVLRKLETLDANAFSSSDRALLTAARAVAAEVVAPVSPAALEEPPLPAGEPVEDEDALEAAPMPDAADAVPAAGPSAPPDATDALVISARSKLDAIDRMLEETE